LQPNLLGVGVADFERRLRLANAVTHAEPGKIGTVTVTPIWL